MAEFHEDSWPMRSWYKRWAGTTFGHGIIFKPGGNRRNTRLYKHELAHVEQYERAMLKGLLYGLAAYGVTGNWILGLVLWAASGGAFVLCNSVVAFLRGEAFYRGASHEEGARGIAAKTTPN